MGIGATYLRRVRLASAECAFPCYWSGAEPQPPTLFGVFGCEWDSFLTGKSRKYSPSLTPWENLGVNGTHFSIALTTFSTLLAPTAVMQPAVSIEIVSFGNSRRGAAANDTGACGQAHIWGLWHVHQNVGLYVIRCIGAPKSGII